MQSRSVYAVLGIKSSVPCTVGKHFTIYSMLQVIGTPVPMCPGYYLLTVNLSQFRDCPDQIGPLSKHVGDCLG